MNEQYVGTGLPGLKQYYARINVSNKKYKLVLVLGATGINLPLPVITYLLFTCLCEKMYIT